MKIVAHIIGCIQVSEDDYQRTIKSWKFDSSVSIDEILQVTKMDDISRVNLSTLQEPPITPSGKE